MRRFTMMLAVIVAVGMTASAALAASAHFKDGSQPSFAKDSTTFVLTASGINLAGLGNGDLRIIINATGTGTAQCQNPGGQSKVPGQNPVAVNVSGTVDIAAHGIKN